MKAVVVYLKYIEIERTVCEIFSGNYAMCLLLECWKSQPFLRKIATIKFPSMETFCSIEVELTWMEL